MPTYEKADTETILLAKKLLEGEHHTLLRGCDPRFDILMAYGDVDEKGIKIGDAITDRGIRALGKARKISLKDRAAGRADGEIVLDGDWWPDATAGEQAAVLDHELYHFEPKIDKRGLQRDDLGRPVFRLRLHDVEVGWFDAIARVHGISSQERQQASKILLRQDGQYYWPELTEEIRAVGPVIATRFARVASGK